MPDIHYLDPCLAEGVLTWDDGAEGGTWTEYFADQLKDGRDPEVVNALREHPDHRLYLADIYMGATTEGRVYITASEYADIIEAGAGEVAHV